MAWFHGIRRLISLGHPWKRLRFALRLFMQEPTIYPIESYPRFDSDLCARMFCRNQTTLHQCVESNGGHAMTYLQPFNGFGPRPLLPSDANGLAHLRRRVNVDGMTELDAMDAVYQRIAAEFKLRHDPSFIDLTGVFDQVRREVYIDQVHCSDIGYDLMARSIAADILRRGGVGPSRDPGA